MRMRSRAFDPGSRDQPSITAMSPLVSGGGPLSASILMSPSLEGPW